MLRSLSSRGLLFFTVLAVSLACEDSADDFGDNFGDESLEDRGTSVVDIYQAENRTATSGCSQKSNHSGFTGSGFMDYGGNGTWVEWNNVTLSQAGEYELIFRYANGSSGNRQGAAIINGKNAGNVSFARSGGWTTWKTDSIKAQLRQGKNTIRVMANTGSGGPNLDKMEISFGDLCPNDPQKVEPGECGCGVPEGTCGNDKNVARGKPTRQSSTAYSGVSSRAVDGNNSGNWSKGSITHTARTSAPWWLVDLGASHQLSGVTLWNRTDCCGDRLSNFHVDYLDQTGRVIAKKDYPGKVGIRADINLAKSGVYSVRVQLNGTNPLSLAEVEVWGSTGGVGTGLCAEAAEHKNANLSCPSGQKINSIAFASYGLPTGSCKTGFAIGSCHASASKSKVQASCLNRSSCSISASNSVFGDPCPGKGKKIAITYTCSGGAIDNCPNDPNKTEPGECGCGVPEGTCDDCTDTMRAGDKILAGQHICSQNGRYEFGLTSAGKLALWSGSDTLWSGGTFGSSVHLIMQGDGNLVVYNPTKALWSSSTHGNSGATLKLENDGRVVIRLGTKVLWSKGGSGPVDNCPNDPNKTEPGKCGCGVPEGTCDNTKSWKFVVVGDSRGSNNGVNTSAWGHLVDAIIDEGAEFVLFPGDLTTGGSSSQFSQWKKTTQPLYDRNIDVYAVRGNHDDNSLSAWNNAFSGAYRFPQNGPSSEKNLTYSVTHKNAFVVGMDNYSGSAEVNQSWLNTQLAANSQPHVFVFGHEPAFAADHSDTLDDHSSARDTFWKSIKNAGGRAYFAGHDHFYDHCRVDDRDNDSSDDLHQFIVGTAGAPFYNFSGNYSGNNGNYKPVQQHFSKQYGYIVVVIDGLDVQMTFKKRSGSSYVAADRFNYTAK